MTVDSITRRLLSSASLYHKVRRRLYHRTSTKKQVVADRTGFYREVWHEAATRLGGTVTALGGALLEIRCGDVVLRTRTNLTSLDDQLTSAVADDKPLVHRLLSEHGLPVPRYLVCPADDLNGAWAFVRSTGRPCVVKPARASGAIGVTTGVASRWDLAKAMAYGGAFDSELLVEQMVAGGIYRLLYLDGELLDAVRRDPPTVVGDGAATIEQLIQTENERRLRGGIAAAQSLIKIDGELTHTLKLAGRRVHSVPGAGETVRLKNVVNDNRREDNVSVADQVSPGGRAGGRRRGRGCRHPLGRRRRDHAGPVEATGGRGRRGARGQPVARLLLSLLQARRASAGRYAHPGAPHEGAVVSAASARPGRPPAILVGANVVTAISVIRSLARAGVEVHLLCHHGAVPSYSRYAHRIPTDSSLPPQEAWLRYLLGPESEELRGAVLLACNDDGLELLLEHREQLARKFRLDVCDPEAQRAMLDKLATYRVAAAAGVPTPRFWPAGSEEEVRAHAGEYAYPLMIKPLHSHEFKRVHEGKYLMASDFDELLAAWRRTHESGVAVVLLEVIPGPDDLLCSYYTYLDESGAPQFHFTKRIIRRYPEHEGFGCFHITDWNPEVRDLGLRLFEQAGLRGVANVEFKRDTRDGRLKVIEVNARFTAANGLVAASGYDLALLVYDRATGRPQPPWTGRPYRTGLRLWYPLDDFLAFLELRGRGSLSFGEWLRSVAHRAVLPYFSAADPKPSIVRLKLKLRTLAAVNARRVAGRWTADGP